MHTDTQVVTLIFTIVTGVGVLLQAAVLLGMFLALRETQKKLHGLTDRLEEHVLPIVSSTRGLVEELSPKVKIITGNLVEASGTLRAQAENVQTVVKDVSSRTRQQTARVDSMITGTLNSIGQATVAIEKGIAVPLRQVNGVLNGLRAGFETLRNKENGVPAAGGGRAVHTRVPSAPVAPVPPVPTNLVTPAEEREAAAAFVRERAAGVERR